MQALMCSLHDTVHKYECSIHEQLYMVIHGPLVILSITTACNTFNTDTITVDVSILRMKTIIYSQILHTTI